MTKKYRKAGPGEPMPLRGRRGEFYHKVMCCDCGLIHTVLLKLTSPNKLIFVAWREKRATAAARKRRQYRQ